MTVQVPAFPAHAGMNRGGKGVNNMGTSVPRACGDEPGMYTDYAALDMRSPRMRG